MEAKAESKFRLGSTNIALDPGLLSNFNLELED